MVCGESRDGSWLVLRIFLPPMDIIVFDTCVLPAKEFSAWRYAIMVPFLQQPEDRPRQRIRRPFTTQRHTKNPVFGDSPEYEIFSIQF